MSPWNKNLIVLCSQNMIDFKLQGFFFFFAVYNDKIDVNHTVQIVVVLCWYMLSVFKVTRGYIAHLLLKTTHYGVAATCTESWCLFSQQHKKNTVLPWSLTVVPTSIPNVDCWCLFLSIWLLLVWYENPASSLFSWSRAILTVCDF